MKRAVLMLLLVSLSFAGEVWDVNTDGAPVGKPVELGGRIIVGTDKGALHGIADGQIVWTQQLEAPVVGDAAIFGEAAIIPTENRVYAVNSAGGIAWSTPVVGVRGVAASDKVYVASETGVHALNTDGTIAWIYNAEEAANEPATSESYIVFSAGEKLVCLRSTGELFWEAEVGEAWNTAPFVNAGNIYVGTGDGNLYSYRIYTGEERWVLAVGEQITTTPTDYGAYIVFGTAGGMLYATSDDEVAWASQLNGMVGEKMVKTTDGSPLLITSTREALYGISPGDGSVLIKKGFADWPLSPAFINGLIIVGTEDSKVHAIDPKRGCSFIYPPQDSVVGDAEFAITGRSYSSGGAAATRIRLNEGPWEDITGEDWEYKVAPAALAYGVHTVECYVSGGEAGPYTTLTFIKASDAAKPGIIVYYPSQVKEGEPFEISATDTYGNTLTDVKATVDGKEFTGDGTIEITIGSSGDKAITVGKTGYADEEVRVIVRSQPTLAYVFGFLFLLALAAYIYIFVIRKKA